MKLIALASAAALCACSAQQPAAPPAQSPSPLVRHFPQAAQASEGEMQALARGELVVANGCLRVRGGDSETSGPGAVIVWPSEAIIEQADGDVRVTNRRNGATMHVGERIEMSGGFSDGVRAGALKDPLPDECPGPYWIAGSEWRPARD